MPIPSPSRKLVIDPAKVGATTSHIPLYYNLAGLQESVWSTISARGNIAVYNSSGVKTPSIVKSLNVGAKTGYIIFDGSASTTSEVVFYVCGNATGEVNSASALTNSGVCLNWEFDEASGSVIDDTGNYSATFGGAQSATGGVLGGNATFDGSNTNFCKTTTNLTQLKSTTDFCLSMRIKSTASSYVGNFLSWGTDGGDGLYSYVDASDICHFRLSTGGDTATLSSISTKFLTGEEANVRLCFNGAGATDTDKFKFLVNGQSQTLSFVQAPPSAMSALDSVFCFANAITAGAGLRATCDNISVIVGGGSYLDGITTYNNVYDPNIFFTATDYVSSPASRGAFSNSPFARPSFNRRSFR